MKGEDGRTVVSATGAMVIGSLWLLGSVAMGWGSAHDNDLGTRLEYTLAWAALGVFPGILLLLVWSYVAHQRR
ncbi:hypothetical protein OO014_15815 [Intrasporangium calvum]|uniref:Uncharacterized protein n=1 Tax=Intrasporangium calvum TaxID=53358 RepID=A0ABT5GKH1_9MICO|nr:hypothetical protein [Intrasporangium calvum]MDC5698723.1 hypothetical protein [Intrasporangium calvum]